MYPDQPQENSQNETHTPQNSGAILHVMPSAGDHISAPAAPSRPPMASIMFGAGLFAVSVLSAIALGSAYMIPVPTPVDTQAAAAAAAPAAKNAFSDVVIEGRSAIVFDIKNDSVLYEKDARLQLPLASITKVALILAVSEVLDPEEIVTISRAAVERGEGGLTWGEEWKAKDLMDYTLLASSNTGAEALAEAADERLRATYPDAPANRAAIWRMNNLAHQLNLTETYFLNPSGLDESATQAGAVGSARNMAVLFSYALRTKPELFEITTHESMYLAPLNYYGSQAHNTNTALDAIPNLVFGKTGYTDLAGGNLGIVFKPEPDRPIAVIVLGSSPEGRFSDVTLLVDAAQKTLSEAR